MTPIQASLEKNELFVYQKLSNKRKNIKPKFQVNDLVRTADLKKTFSKLDLTIWSYNLYRVTENIKKTKPSYHIDNLPECYNDALLKKTNLTMKVNKDVTKKLNITLIKSKCLFTSLDIENNLFVNINA